MEHSPQIDNPNNAYHYSLLNLRHVPILRNVMYCDIQHARHCYYLFLCHLDSVLCACKPFNNIVNRDIMFADNHYGKILNISPMQISARYKSEIFTTEPALT